MSIYVDSAAPPPRTLTDAEQRLLLRTSGEHVRGYRDHVIFSLALSTGLREHEILALDVGDVFAPAGRRAGKSRRRVVLCVFKRSSDKPAPQEVVLPDAVRAKLDKLYRWKKRAGQSVAPSAPLFVSRLGRRLSARQLREVFHVWQERAGFERRFGFHALRHTACTNLYGRTHDIRLTQRFALSPRPTPRPRGSTPTSCGPATRSPSAIRAADPSLARAPSTRVTAHGGLRAPLARP